MYVSLAEREAQVGAPANTGATLYGDVGADGKATLLTASSSAQSGDVDRFTRSRYRTVA
jgi:hypothetical protein